jgi:uncharacterized protein (DUF488 family)
LVAVLHASGVRRLLDIRQVAFSRRAEYRKGPLERSLAEAGIEYVHVHAAGNPYRDDADRKRCLASYRAHVRRNPTILQTVRAAIGNERGAVLCYERAHAECHRSVLLAALESVVAGRRVVTVE